MPTGKRIGEQPGTPGTQRVQGAKDTEGREVLQAGGINIKPGDDIDLGFSPKDAGETLEFIADRGKSEPIRHETVGGQSTAATPVSNTSSQTLRFSPEIQGELGALKNIESSGGRYKYPLGKDGKQDPTQDAFGDYMMKPISFIDAIINNVDVPDEVKHFGDNWENLTKAERLVRLEELNKWKHSHQAIWDKVAQQEYEMVRKKRSNGDPVLANLNWLHPGHVKKALKNIGVARNDFGPDHYAKLLDELYAGSQTGQYSHEFGPRIERMKQIQTEFLPPGVNMLGPVLPPPPPKTTSQPQRAQSDVEAYVQDTARANRYDEMRTRFGPKAAAETKKWFGRDVANNIEDAQAAAQEQTLEADPISDQQVTWFNDNIPTTPITRDTGLGVLPDILDFTASIIGGMADPSTFDPLASIEMLAGGSLVRKGVQGKKSIEVSQKAFKPSIDARQKQVDDTVDKLTEDLEDIKAEIDLVKQDPLHTKDDLKELVKAKQKTGRDLHKAKMMQDPAAFEAKVEDYDNAIAELDASLAKTKGTQSATGIKKRQQETKMRETLVNGRNRLAKQVEQAKKSMRAITADDMDSIATATQSAVEAKRLSDEWRIAFAEGLVLGPDGVRKKADELEAWADRLVKDAIAHGAPPAEAKAASKNIFDTAQRLRRTAVLDAVRGKRMTLKTLLKGEILDVPMSVQKTAQDMLLLRQAKKMEALVDDMLNADVTTKVARTAAFEKEYKLLNQVYARIAGDELSVGQTQRIAGLTSQNLERKSDLTGTVWMDIMKNPETSETPETIGRRFKVLLSERQKAAHWKNLMAKGGVIFDTAEDAWLASMISGIGTLVWNVGSMATLTAMRTAEFGMARTFGDPMAAKGQAGVFARSLIGSYWKLLALRDPKTVASFMKEQKRASSVWRNQKIDPNLAAKLGIPTASGSLFRSTQDLGVAFDLLAYSVKIPRWAVASTDSVFRFAIKDAMVDMMAHNKASFYVQDLLNQGAKLSRADLKKAYQLKRREVLDDPNAVFEWMGDEKRLVDIAKNEADMIAMMGDLLTPSGRAIDSYVRSNKVGRVALPFFRVFAISTRETINRMGPASWMLLPTVRADVAAGGQRAAMAKAKMASGTMLAASAAALWAEGILSDGGPLDPELNKRHKATEPVYTLNVGSLRVPLERLGVVGEILMYTADMARAMEAIPGTLKIRADDPTSTNYTLPLEAASKLIALHTAVAGNDMMHDDIQRLLRGALTGDENAVQQWIAQRASAMVPASAFNRNIRDYLYKERHTADGFLATVWKQLPFGTLNGNSTARTFYGDKTADFTGMNFLTTSAGFVGNDVPRADTKNYVREKLEDHELSVTGINKTMSSENATIELTMNEWNYVKEHFGKLQLPGKEPGSWLYIDEALKEMIDSKKWIEGSPEAPGTDGTRGSRAKSLQSVTDKYKKKTKQWFLGGSPIPSRGLEKPSKYAATVNGRLDAERAFGQGIPQEPDFFGADEIRDDFQGVKNFFNLGGS